MLREFYESVKCCNTFTMNLASGPAGVISIADRGGSEWFEMSTWHGMVSHIGGLHLALAPDVGALVYARSNGDLIPQNEEVTGYGRHSVFFANVLTLAMTYMYAGRRDTGLELARRVLSNLVLEQRCPWDWLNMVDGRNGGRIYGTDYCDVMTLWALPAATEDESLGTWCRGDPLMKRVLGEPEG